MCQAVCMHLFAAPKRLSEKFKQGRAVWASGGSWQCKCCSGCLRQFSRILWPRGDSDWASQMFFLQSSGEGEFYNQLHDVLQVPNRFLKPLWPNLATYRCKQHRPIPFGTSEYDFWVKVVIVFLHRDPEYCLHAPAIFAVTPRCLPVYAAFGLLLSCLRRSHKPPFFCRFNRLTVNDSSTGL